MNYLTMAFIITTLVGCRQQGATTEDSAQTQNHSDIQVRYLCPEDYSRILSRLVYARVKDKDPFAIDPDNPPKELRVSDYPMDSLRALGFRFLPGEHISSSSSNQVLIVMANANRHKDLVIFHANLGIRIEDVEQDGTGQPATHSESKSEGSDKPQPEPEGRSR